jgi:hypothetical protein
MSRESEVEKGERANSRGRRRKKVVETQYERKSAMERERLATL